MVTETSGLPRYDRVLATGGQASEARQYQPKGARRLHIYEGYHVGLEYASLKLQEAYQTYYEARNNAPAWRDEHNQSRVDALVDEGKARNSSAEKTRARMKKEKSN